MENYSESSGGNDAGDSATVSAPEPGYDIPPHRTTRRAAPPPPPLTSDQNEFDNARQPTSPSRIRSEEDYRLWLESNFQHYFDQHEAEGGIPTRQLVEILCTDQNADRLHQRKLSRLMTDMNANPDGRVSWKEFFSKLTITRRQDLSRTQLFLVELIRAAVPAVERYEQKQIFRWTGVDQLDGAEKETDYESYLEAYNCRPPSIFIPVCCLAQIICFIVYAVELNNGPDVNNRVGWATGLPYYSPLLFSPQKKKEAWRFISYMLLHCGYHHLLFNLAIQLLLGVPLELVHKAWRVGPTYMAGVLGGSVCSAVFDHTTALVGASGGCYALMGAHIALVVMNWKETQHEWLKCRKPSIEGGGIGSVAQFLLSGVMRLVFLLLLLALDFGVALYQRYGLNEDTRVSFLAHAGGLIFGFLVGIPVLKNLDKLPWEVCMFWICLVIGICLMVAAVLYLGVSDFIGTY